MSSIEVRSSTVILEACRSLRRSSLRNLAEKVARYSFSLRKGNSRTATGRLANLQKPASVSVSWAHSASASRTSLRATRELPRASERSDSPRKSAASTPARSTEFADGLTPIGHSSVCGDPIASIEGFMSLGERLANQLATARSGGSSAMSIRKLTSKSGAAPTRFSPSKAAKAEQEKPSGEATSHERR